MCQMLDQPLYVTRARGDCQYEDDVIYSIGMNVILQFKLPSSYA
jgi:hypothetical protein